MKTCDSLYVIDDDVMYQYIAKQIIESTGLAKKITVFPNGLEAINGFEKELNSGDQLPDVILLDLMMPIMDGWGFLNGYANLKSRVQKKIRIYIVSTSFNPLDVERAKTISDVTGYIVKPITRAKFEELFQEM